MQKDAAEELARPAWALAFSGLFAGATVGFSALAAGTVTALLGPGSRTQLVAGAVYPIGFVVAIVGRAQLFTENTLYPVTIALDRPRCIGAMLRLWVIVFATNLIGALLCALLFVKSGGISSEIARAIADSGRKLSSGSWSAFFWSGVVAGWLLALVAWLSEATSEVIGQVTLIWALTFVIGAAGFAHCVSTTVEVLSSTLRGEVSVGHFFSWLGPVTAGNIVGGVAIVALLNYGQVRAGND